MEIALIIVAVFVIIKLNGSINQLLGMATGKLDVLEVKSTYDDAKALGKIAAKIENMGEVRTASEIMKVLQKKGKKAE